jgi:hypothetical protein
MDNLVCPDCGTTYYSAAAKTMIDRGERCDCGAVLVLAEEAEVPVPVPAAYAPRNGETPDQGGRRFRR